MNPIELNDIDESNEWLMGRMDGSYSNDEDDDLVFEDDDLTWKHVSQATGAEEPIHLTRAEKIQVKLTKEKALLTAQQTRENYVPALPYDMDHRDLWIMKTAMLRRK